MSLTGASKILSLVAKVRESCSAPVPGLLSTQHAQPVQKGWTSSSCPAPHTQPCPSSPLSLEPSKTLPLPSISNCSCLKLTGSKSLLPRLPLVFFQAEGKGWKFPVSAVTAVPASSFLPCWETLGGVKAWMQPGAPCQAGMVPAFPSLTGTDRDKGKLQAWKGCLLQRFMASEHDQPSGLITKGERSMFLSADLQGYYLMKQICR